MFENRENCFYLKAKNGKILATQGKGSQKTVTEHDFVVGKIINIKYVESLFNMEKIKSWNVVIKGENGVGILTIGYSSNFARSFFNALCNANIKKPIKFGCYVKNDYNLPVLLQNEEMIKWKYQEIPKAERVQVGSKEVFNDDNVAKWITERVEEILAKLNTPNQDINSFPPLDSLNDLPF
jgi:hypothetical protein